MFKRTTLTQSILLALLAPGVVTHASAVEVTGYIKNETAIFAHDNQLIGEARNAVDNASHHDRLMKFENSARIFLNGDITDGVTWHGELNVVYDTEGVNEDYKGHELYTQNDWLREIYVDAKLPGWDLRLGKQQVVWGKADGIKLLDVINPTDWREFTQNTMEDSRIPVFMVRADHALTDKSDIQLIVSQVEENKIPGLNKQGDTGHAFIMKGVDTITGDVNGFQNIVPKLTNVATSFTQGAVGGMFNGLPPGATPGLVPFAGMSVGMFAGMQWSFPGVMTPVGPVATNTDNVQNLAIFGGGTSNGYTILNAIAQQGLGPDGLNMNPALPTGYGNHSTTNLMGETGSPWTMAAPTSTTVTWNTANPGAAFEYMQNASFATFNNSSGNDWMAPPGTPGLHGAAKSAYVRDYPDDMNANFGFRYRNSLDNGLNFSLNYFYGYTDNAVNLICRDDRTGEVLQHELRRPNNLAVPNYSNANATVIGNDQVANTFDGTIGVAYNSARQYYGAFNPMTGGVNAFGDATHSPNGILMTFVETLERTQNIGGSFDYAFDTSFSPVVVRGEFLFKKDEMHPVIDKRLLGIGYLPEAMKSEAHDMFKYVLGVDVTVLTNMMISAQFIQFRNLDYVNEKRTCTTQMGTTFDCSKYTADLPTLHLSNGLNRAEENKEFYSLFFSKPFGPSQEHRWNNILMYEENGGYWDRFDVEYSFTDKLIGSAEVNAYWGDENTMFGQFKESSNVQVGIKYLFD